MNMTIPKKYLKAKEDKKFCSTYIITAPENVQEFTGYVMKIMQDYTSITDNSITFRQGNEWNKKKQQSFYMFEKEVKIPGHPSKRYRYTEEELVKLYGNALSPTFEKRLEKRKQIFEKGPGRLLRTSYTDFSIRNGKKSKEG